jgi:DNA-binding XRE family transcriptional regulator
MLVATKKHRTKLVRLVIEGPASHAAKLKTTLAELGFHERDESIPWREALGYSDHELPGVLLAGARYREGFTQEQLSQKTGIRRHHISEMETSKRPIGKKNARKLGEVLNVDPRRFLSL